MTFDTPQRILRRNHRKSLPSHMVFLDVETEKEKCSGEDHLHFKMAWTCYVKTLDKSHGRTDQWDFWDSSLALAMYLDLRAYRKRPLYVFGHNVFVDLQAMGFFKYFTNAGWSLDFFYDSGLSYILVIRKGNRTIKCLSTTNYFNSSVRAIGEVLGLPKLDVDFESVCWQDLKTYCKRDVEIIREAMRAYFDLIQREDLGKFSLTKAAQAFSAFRHRFMTRKIYLHRHPETIDLERAAIWVVEQKRFTWERLKAARSSR